MAKALLGTNIINTSADKIISVLSVVDGKNTDNEKSLISYHILIHKTPPPSIPQFPVGDKAKFHISAVFFGVCGTGRQRLIRPPVPAAWPGERPHIPRGSCRTFAYSGGKNNGRRNSPAFGQFP